jgi:hypothetical protein
MKMVARTSALRPKAFGRRAAFEVRGSCLMVAFGTLEDRRQEPEVRRRNEEQRTKD